MSCLVNHFQLRLPICLPRQLDGELTWAEKSWNHPFFSAQILPKYIQYCCWKKWFSVGFFLAVGWSEPGKNQWGMWNSDIHHLNWCKIWSWNKWKIMTRVLGLAYPHLPTEASTFILTGRKHEKIFKKPMLMVQKSGVHQLRLVVFIPLFYKGSLYIPGGDRLGDFFHHQRGKSWNYLHLFTALH